MALRLNLYHEVLLAKKQEQYDPLKLSMLGMILVGVCLAGYYIFELASKSSAQRVAAAAQAEFDQLQPQAIAAKTREDELSKDIGLADKLTKRIESRFYWAPVLEQIAAAVPRNAQLYKISGDVTLHLPHRCQLNIEGMAAGAEPRKVAEDLRTALAERLGAAYLNVNAAFRSLDDSAERVILDGNKLATVAFTIVISFDMPDPPKADATAAGIDRGIAQKN